MNINMKKISNPIKILGVIVVFALISITNYFLIGDGSEYKKTKKIEEIQTLLKNNFDSGNANRLTFKNNKVIIEIDRYYDGSWNTYSIEGVYSINENSIIINWNKNYIEYENLFNECGIQTVRQKMIFTDIIKVDLIKRKLIANYKFSQKWISGGRCGDENYEENDAYVFEIVD